MTITVGMSSSQLTKSTKQLECFGAGYIYHLDPKTCWYVDVKPLWLDVKMVWL